MIYIFIGIHNYESPQKINQKLIFMSQQFIDEEEDDINEVIEAIDSEE